MGERFARLERKILTKTITEHNSILNKAETYYKKNPKANLSGAQNLTEKHQIAFKLRSESIKNFYNKSKHLKLRILLHVPAMQHSPGGYSLFSNLMDGLRHIGVECLAWNAESETSFEHAIQQFAPNVFLTSDHSSYLSQIDWSAFLRYKQHKQLRFGMTASLEEYGNTPLKGRLTWAREHGINFFYSFRTPEYITERYTEFLSSGYKVLSMEFGANPLIHFPVPSIPQKLDYIFLASSNPDKQRRYVQYLPKILGRHFGFVDGPGWYFIHQNWAPRQVHSYLYSMAKVGINLHIDDSLNWASELNERAYILAACGVPQLIDNAKLLDQRFSNDSVFLAKSPVEYYDTFKYMLAHPEICESKASAALHEVYERHTVFHRAENFVKQLEEL